MSTMAIHNRAVRNISSFLWSNLFSKNGSKISVGRAFSDQKYKDESYSPIFRQLFDQESWTYTYLVADPMTKEAVLIDPVLGQEERDVAILQELGLKLKYACNTHMHADHITSSGALKNLLSGCASIISAASGAQADVLVHHGDKIKFGKLCLDVRSTPGHTNGCMSLVMEEENLVFTGDALLIRGCGRTDFQEGCSRTLYRSVHSQIFTLPNFFKVYPAHDYRGVTVSTIGEEKRFNSRLKKTEKGFVEFMENLNLPYPKKIDESLPANKVCGLHFLPEKN